MLDSALHFLKEELNTYIEVKTGRQRENVVKFAKIQMPKNITMQDGAITVFLINVEEERLFRSGVAQNNRLTSGNTSRDSQSLCLNFHVLFIANFNDYEDSLKFLSLTLKFFRSYRIFTQQRFPFLSPDIQQLTTELVNLTFMEQSELWQSLELPFIPSALYKVGMLVFPDDEINLVETIIESVEIQTTTLQF